MGQSGWIVATDNRNGGRIRRFSPAAIAASPQNVRAFLGLNADVDPREADAMIERAGAAWATGADRMRAVASGAAKAAGVYPLMAVTAGAGIGGAVGSVASADLGLGFVGSTMLPGFTAGVGSQAGADLQAAHWSGVPSYAVSGSFGAVGSLAISGSFAAGRQLFGTADAMVSIMPDDGWPWPTLANPGGTLPARDVPNFIGRAKQINVYDGEVLYGIRDLGSRNVWWTRVRPLGELQWRMDQAVLPAWNRGTVFEILHVPEGSRLIGFEGPARGQGPFFGGGNQVYIPDVPSGWISARPWP
jgi:hypothetical protein